MIISDIVLNRDCQTTDVIMDTGLTITDVIIYDLSHYFDLFADDLSPSAMILKTNADVMPYIIMFDHSDTKTDSVVMKLKSSCSNIRTATSFPLGESEAKLTTSLDALVTKALLAVNENTIKIQSQQVAVCCYCPTAIEHTIPIETELVKDLSSKVYMLPISFELTNIDDVHIIDLDPFTLPEIDMMNGYYQGIRLQVHMDLTTNTFVATNELNSKLQSTVKLSIIPLVRDYDDWLVTDMDEYTIYDLERELD